MALLALPGSDCAGSDRKDINTMKNNLKLILIISGAVFVLLGGYLTWTALYPGMGEFQDLTVADYTTGKTIEVSIHYPLRVLIGKTSLVRVKFDAPADLIPGCALDQQLDLPNFVIIPQPRIITSLIEGQEGTAVWKIDPVTPEQVQAGVSFALESVPNGMFALSPTAQTSFQIEAFDVLGMEYATLLKTGLIFAAIGALTLFAGLKLRSSQPKRIKQPHIYG